MAGFAAVAGAIIPETILLASRKRAQP